MLVNKFYCFVPHLLFFFIDYISSKPNIFVYVKTANGIVQGFESITEANKTFYVFKGLRYAQPPVGNLRFRSPKPVKNWNGTYNATYERNECISTPYGSNNIVGDEDCLFLNVYSPNLNDDEKLAVVVWFHGGAFIFGSGNLGTHGADRFMDQNVILVSLNYRLGLFGFLCTEDNIIPGNYGLKDQIMALKWIQKNIHVFGGDPNNVCLFGESAGAVSVQLLRQSENAQNLFQRVIAHSGSSLNPWSLSPNPKQIAFRIGLLNGIWTVSTKTLLEKLRKVDSMKLQRSALLPFLLDLWDPLNGLPFSPCMELPSADAVVTDFSYELQKSGRFNPGELLLGYNSLEAREAAKLPWYGIILLEQYNLDTSKLCPKNMHASSRGARDVGNNVHSFYFYNRPVNNNTNLVNYVSDDEFVRGIIKTAELESNFADVYLYEFSFTGGANHVAFKPEGVSHTEELQFFFLSNNSIQTTAESRLTTERVMQMWTNFAKVGNPTPNVNNIVNIIWPVVNVYGPANVYYLDINTNLTINVNPRLQHMQFWDQMYYNYGYPPYNTY